MKVTVTVLLKGQALRGMCELSGSDEDERLIRASVAERYGIELHQVTGEMVAATIGDIITNLRWGIN